MSKKFRFRGHFEKQHGKLTETLLKSEQQPLGDSYFYLSKQFTLKSFSK